MRGKRVKELRRLFFAACMMTKMVPTKNRWRNFKRGQWRG